MQNEYLSVCDVCYKKTWYDTEQPCHCEYPKTKTCDTCNHTEQTLDKNDCLIMEKCFGTLRVIDNSQLDQRFAPYYKSGQRIEVTYKDNTKERFYIGKSTGWKPIWTTIKTLRSMGGFALFCEDVMDIKPLNTHK